MGGGAPRQRYHGAWTHQLLARHGEVLEPAGRDQHARLEAADGVVEVADGCVEGPPDVVDMGGERRETLMELAAEPVDLARVVGQRLVAPAVRHRAEQR